LPTSLSSSTSSTGSCAAPTASPTPGRLPARHRMRPARSPDWAGYNANLLIDHVGFIAHSLCVYRREPLQ
jgi:hypothetical protein